MSGFDDLVVAAQPALLGGGLIHEGLAEGSTWSFTLEIEDFDGNPVDWTDVTAAGYLYSDREGESEILVTFDVTLPAAGIVQVSADTTVTPNTADPNAALGLFLSKAGTPPQVVAICLPHNSPCPVRSDD